MKFETYKKIIPFYLGCECTYPNTNNKLIKAILTGYSVKDGVETTYKRKKDGCMDDYICAKDGKERGHNTYIENIRLILRPLDSMTELEYYEITKYPLNLPYHDFMDKIKRNKILEWDPYQFIWLCNHHFDVFELIKAGFAIKKEE